MQQPVFERRVDPIVGRQVLIAEVRDSRPNDFRACPSPSDSTTSQADCPFCVGQELQTPQALLELTDEHGDWQVRVVPNKFPAVGWDHDGSKLSGMSALESFPERPDGAHEVFIESRHHVQDITEVSSAQLARILLLVRDRLRFWATDPRIEHVTLFKNVGYAAGASLEHIHSQLVALPDTPSVMATELRSCGEYYSSNQACLFCKLVEEELAHRQRLVVDAGSFVAFCAYASRQPYETWILPRKHSHSFEYLNDLDAACLAEILQQVVERLKRHLAPCSYNLILHTAPFRDGSDRYYHWHFELVPRTTQLAGLEWGAGMHINPVAPERAAQRLRDVASSRDSSLDKFLGPVD